MAVKRGRGRSEFGQAFSPFMVSGSSSGVAGQPMIIRTWGIPTGPGWFDRPGKWNALLPPLIAGALELARRILSQVKSWA